MSSQRVTDAQAQRFRRIAWPLMPVVLRTAQCLTADAAHAEDLAQETMIKAMRAIDAYQDDTDIRAWLLTILRRTHIDALRAGRHRSAERSLDAHAADLSAPPDADAPPAGRFDDQWDEPEELLERFEDEAVIAALRALPEAMRWTLLLVDVERMDHADAAAVLNVAVGTVKSRASRARAMLRDRLHQVAVQRRWLPARETLP